MKKNIKILMIASSNSEVLYLLSSNASEKYISDVLETLSLPFGFVQHFRYQLKWIHSDLREKLPIKHDPNRKKLLKNIKNTKIIVCYLHQIRENDKWKWNAIFPFRLGILVEAYKTGKEDCDIAHFYFRLENYIKPNNWSILLTRLVNNQELRKKPYAFLCKISNDIETADKENSMSVFHKICDSNMFDHFRSQGKNYQPLYCFIEGFRKKKGRIVKPKFHRVTNSSYYKLNEGSKYSFNFSVYFKRKTQQFNFLIRSDSRVFSTPKDYEIPVLSRYDEITNVFITSLLERDVWTNIYIESKLNNNTKIIPLNIKISIPIKIKRKVVYRIIDAVGDIAFGLATATLALSKTLTFSWWYIPVICGYSIWALFKLIIKIWRG